MLLFCAIYEQICLPAAKILSFSKILFKLHNFAWLLFYQRKNNASKTDPMERHSSTSFFVKENYCIQHAGGVF